MKSRLAERFGMRSKLITILARMTRWAAKFFLVLWSGVKPSAGRGVVIFALPKSGSTLVESVVGDLFPKPAYIPLTGIFADFQSGMSHTCQLSRLDVWVLSHFSVTCKTHLQISERDISALGSKNRILILERAIEDCVSSAAHYIDRTPWHSLHGNFRVEQYRESLDEWVTAMARRNSWPEDTIKLRLCADRDFIHDLSVALDAPYDHVKALYDTQRQTFGSHYNRRKAG